MLKIRCVAVLVICVASVCFGQTDPSGKDWLSYGRTNDDHRFSPLREINEQNVARLGLAWSHELDTTRGLEATPLVKNGVLYFTGAWSVVYAYDAKTGKLRWAFDPKVSREKAYFYCCDVVNRGVALYAGKVFVGTLDGRMIAINERTGAADWTVNTVEGNNNAYSITSAPRIARGKVVIGNAGSEYGVRGYVSAYDAETGKLKWRTYTVPGNPAKGFESKALEEAAKTWRGEWWKFGGGGTPWEGMVYDPDLDLLYFGTGNPTSWYRELRGDGSSLYTSCILAVHAANGELAWYFQTTPGDNWDYDATQPLVQADLKINGRLRKTIMQANKNGFFYVLDRETGEFISGAAFVDGITWAKGLDKNGRPIENPGVAKHAEIISPGPFGGHNWTPMAFSDATGLMYLAAKSGSLFLHAPAKELTYDPNKWNFGLTGYEGPLNEKLAAAPPPRGELLAWDPVEQKAVWHAPSPTAETGGVLATAGNLVFQGRADGVFAAYRASDGRQLWSFDAGTGILAAPVSYEVDGEQYVSVLAGWGGASALLNPPGFGPVKPGFGRILTFKLNSHTPFNPPAYKQKLPTPPPATADASAELIKQGAAVYGGNCASCHGVNAVAGPLPDLRYTSKVKLDHLDDIVLRGALAEIGMPSFGKILKEEDVRALQAFLTSRAREVSAQK